MSDRDDDFNSLQNQARGAVFQTSTPAQPAPASERLKEIRDVLLEARYTTDYNIGSPAALYHLLVHVVALIDALLANNGERS
jgi:hypothetical protein